MPRTFETERTGRVLSVLFDNPPLNFMNRVMVGELDNLLDSLEHDRSLGSVILTGKPEGLFITHYDVEEILAGSEGVGRSISATVAGASLQTIGGVARFPGGRAALNRTAASGLLELQRTHDVFSRMQRMDKVFIAAINGPALGGGCEISLACDLRYMSEEARWIGLPEMTLGFCPGAGGTQRLPRILGTSRALELILEGRPLRPIEARDLGLVHRVVAAPELAAEAQATADRLARRAPTIRCGGQARGLRGVHEAARRRTRRGAKVVHGVQLPTSRSARDARLRRAGPDCGSTVVRRRGASEVAERNRGGPGHRGLSRLPARSVRLPAAAAARPA